MDKKTVDMVTSGIESLEQISVKSLPTSVITQLKKGGNPRHGACSPIIVTAGQVYAALHVESSSIARSIAKGGQLLVMPWVWPMPSGRVFTVTLSVKKHGMVSRAASSDDDGIMNSFLDTGIITCIIFSKGRLISATRSDFRGKEMLDKALQQSKKPIERRFHDPDVAFWEHLGSEKPDSSISKLFGREKNVREAWAHLWKGQVDYAFSFIAKARRELQDIGVEWVPDSVQTTYGELLTLILLANDEKDAEIAAYDWLNSSCEEHPELVAANLFYAWSYGGEEMRSFGDRSENICCLTQRFFVLAAIHRHNTLAGARCISINPKPEGGFRVDYLNLDFEAVGCHEQAFWLGYTAEGTLWLSLFLTGRDCLLGSGFEIDLALQEGESLSETDKQTKALLAESTARRIWTIPWGARVELLIAPFVAAEIFEIYNEYIFLLRDASERCVILYVGRDTGDWSSLEFTDHADHSKLEAYACIRLILASIVRDMSVVETRETVFGERIETTSLPAKSPTVGGGKELTTRRIVYVPRIQYIQRLKPSNVKSQLATESRSAHYVVGHFRNSKGRSADMEKVAASYGFILPEGKTFVRPHTRGSVNISTQEVIYRSRSAMHCLYQVVEGDISGKVDWFQFEIDVKRFLEKMGLEVQHRSAARNGDGGVDIFAYTKDKTDQWAIQCKRYREGKTIGPDVVRELIGSLTAFPAGTKGVVITTASFSANAQALAEDHKILLINGYEWGRLISADLH